jgi:hypothetical protein
MGGRVPDVRIRVLGLKLFTLAMTMAAEKHSRLMDVRSLSFAYSSPVDTE